MTRTASRIAPPDGAPSVQRSWRLFHPLCGTPFWNWARLLAVNGGFDMRCLAQAACISTFSLFHGIDRSRYWLQYGRHVRRITPRQPLFVIGHWRSGTTLVHELLARDPGLGHTTMWHTLVPKSACAFGVIRPLFERMIPKLRPMDNMAAHILAPHEEEAGMANLSPWSFHHIWYFPDDPVRQFERGALLEGLSEREVRRWKRAYMHLVKMVTFGADGRRIVLKNPANTARIPMLLEMFPDARFIFVYRNPYAVYPSMVWLLRSMARAFSLQGREVRGVEDHVFTFYRRLLERYFATRDLIPEGRLVEIRFEDLEADPLGRIEEAYDALKIGGFEAARPPMEAYLDSVASHRKNAYRLDPATAERIRAEWAFAIERWGYEAPRTSESPTPPRARHPKNRLATLEPRRYGGVGT